MIECPICGKRTGVKDSRLITGENAVVRRRVCPVCRSNIYTEETVKTYEIGRELMSRKRRSKKNEGKT